MNRKVLLTVTIFAIAFFVAWFEYVQAPKSLEILEQTSYTVRMQIESSVFKNNQALPKKYTCDGESINPPNLFRDIPAEAKSLALIMEDPDVPLSIRSDGMFDHWLIWNISPETEAVEEGIPPAGTFGRNTRGTEKYVAPCPPDREHRYFFKLFALDTRLDIPGGSSKSELLSVMKGHIINEAGLVGTYNRTR